LLIGALVFVAFGILGVNPAPYLPQVQHVTPVKANGLVEVFLGVVVFSPVAETLLMSLLLWGLSWVVQHKEWQAAWSAALWAGLHASRAPLWGVFVAWPFFVFSRAYLAWRPSGLWKAIGVTTGIHMVHNSLPALVLLIAVLRGVPFM